MEETNTLTKPLIVNKAYTYYFIFYIKSHIIYNSKEFDARTAKLGTKPWLRPSKTLKKYESLQPSDFWLQDSLYHFIISN